MDIIRVENTDELLQLGKVWDEILDKNTVYTPFLTHTWLTKWWKWFHGKRKLFVLIIKSGSEIVGIAPFMIDKKKSGVRRLEFMIDEHGSRFDVIALPNMRTGIIEAIVGYLVDFRKMWDECLLNYYPSFSENYGTLKEVLQKKGLTFDENLFYSPYIEINTEWETFLLRKNKKFRDNLRNNINKARKEKMTCRMVSPDDMEEAIGKVFEIERNSWKYKKGTSLVSNGSSYGFYRDIIMDTAVKGHLYLGLMEEREGRSVAYDFNWARGNCIYSLKMGYDERVRSIGAGKVLFAYTLERSFKDGFKYHELMGIDEQFKSQWTEDIHEHSRLHLYHRGLRSRICYSYNFKIKKVFKTLLKQNSRN